MRVMSESKYQNALEKILGGAHERMGVFGISDITTEEFHAEIKVWHNWREALSQLLVYNFASPRPDLRVYLFGQRPSSYCDHDMQSIINMFKKYGITMYHIEMQSDSHVCIQNIATSTVTEHTIEPPMIDVAVASLSDEEKTAIENAIRSTDFIDVDEVAKWLKVLKNNIVKTLRNSYVDGKDYTLVKEPNPVQRKYGSNNWSTVRMSPSCFKEFVMRSHCKTSAIVRAYLLQKNL